MIYLSKVYLEMFSHIDKAYFQFCLTESLAFFTTKGKFIFYSLNKNGYLLNHFFNIFLFNTFGEKQRHLYQRLLNIVNTHWLYLISYKLKDFLLILKFFNLFYIFIF